MNTATATPQVVHIGRFGFPATDTISIQRRDAEITLLVDALVPILYKAMQLGCLGAIDHIGLEDLPAATITQLRADARQALQGQNNLHKEEAQRHAKLTMTREIQTAVRHFELLNPDADLLEMRRRKEAMYVVLRHLELMRVDRQVIDAHAKALAEPLSMNSTAQVTLTAMRGVI